MDEEGGSDVSRRGRPPATAGPKDVRRRRTTVVLLAVLAVAAILLAVPRIAVSVALQMASTRIGACEYGPALGWLAWSARLDPGNYETDLLKAACHRNRGEPEEWQASLREAQRKGAPDDRIALEVKLGRFQSGGVADASESQVAAMVAVGASLADVGTAILQGHFARDDAATAKAFLEALPGLFDPPQADYLWGMYWRRARDLMEAEKRLKHALLLRPGHELARAELADLFEEKAQLRDALQQYVELARRGGPAEGTVAGLSRVLRKEGRLEEARAVLAPLVSRVDASPLLEVELAQLALEAGDVGQAEQRLAKVPPEGADFRAVAIPAMLALSLRGKGIEAQRLFDRTAEARDQSGWFLEAPARKPDDSSKQGLDVAVGRLGPGDALPPLDTGPGRDAKGPPPNSPAGGEELFAANCSTCHGVKGDGWGRAARYLFPRPRGFGITGLQVVSTQNGVASLEDVERVLARGMPGTAMQAFDTLSPADRTRLAREVLRLRREGARDQIARALRDAGEDPAESEVREAVERTTTPGPPVPLPRQWRATEQAAARGKADYRTLGCAKCHGDDGKGAPEQSLFDAQGEPNRARDLVDEPFKGGREPESIYLRLVAGMPGTAHPAAPGLPEEQVSDLVEYVRSLARRPECVLTNHDRRVRADTRIYLERLGR